jgi:hypothetical protein
VIGQVIGDQAGLRPTTIHKLPAQFNPEATVYPPRITYHVSRITHHASLPTIPRDIGAPLLSNCQ